MDEKSVENESKGILDEKLFELYEQLKNWRRSVNRRTRFARR